MNEKKIIFIISQKEVVDTVGGAITVFTNYCNKFADNGYEVYAICSNKLNGFPQNLNSKVKFINLFYEYEGQSFSEGMNNLAKDKKPDLFIFFFNFLYENANLNTEFDNIPRILMIHSRPDIYFAEYNDKKTEKIRTLYKNVIIQLLFDSYFDLLPKFLKNKKVITIPNGVILPEKHADVEVTERKKIVYLSRIDKAKGLEFLIHSFKLISKKYPDWSIDIYGQSQPPNYVFSLKKLTKKLKLDRQIFFKGVTNSLPETFYNYDFCVFPSLFEGTPLGLLEAQSTGLSCIGLKGCTGVNELIKDNENGLLADYTYIDFAKKIEMLIKDRDKRIYFCKNAVKSAKKYEIEKIYKMWLNTVDDIINKKDLRYITKPQKSIYQSFEVNDIVKIYNNCDKYKFYQYIFSMTNRLVNGRKKKIIYFFGFKFTLKRTKNYVQ